MKGCNGSIKLVADGMGHESPMEGRTWRRRETRNSCHKEDWLIKTKSALEMYDLTPEIKASGFNTSIFKGVNVHIPRLVTDITDSGWIGPDHPNTATVEWGNEMLDTTVAYIIDFIEAFKKVPLKTEAGVGK